MNDAVKLARHPAKWNLLILCLFVLTGCQTVHDTEFSPVEATLAPINNSGVQHLVLANSAGKDLHHFHLRAYVWGDSPLAYSGDPATSLPSHNTPGRTYTAESSGDVWRAGEAIHFRDRYLGSESRLMRPVLKVQIVGSCDEGVFRETWLTTQSGQLVQAESRQKVQ